MAKNRYGYGYGSTDRNDITNAARELGNRSKVVKSVSRTSESAYINAVKGKRLT